MRKAIYGLALLTIGGLTASCIGSRMVTKSPQEVKMMTTKQFETNKDLVVKSIISLLQSESYMIEDVNDKVGLIRASKRIENENAALQRIFTNSSEDASTSKVVFYVEEFNNNLCEVKLTIYQGSETTTINRENSHQNKEVKESMVYDASIYNGWFMNLRAEIERRKALTR